LWDAEVRRPVGRWHQHFIARVAECENGLEDGLLGPAAAEHLASRERIYGICAYNIGVYIYIYRWTIYIWVAECENGLQDGLFGAAAAKHLARRERIYKKYVCKIYVYIYTYIYLEYT